MQRNFHKSAIISSISIVLFALSCTTQQSFEKKMKISLEGVWELDKRYTGTSIIHFGTDMKSYKIIYGDHWAVAGHNHSEDLNWGFAGSYRITKDTYVEYLEIVRNPENLGDSLVYKYTLKNDTLLILRPGSSESWKRIE